MAEPAESVRYLKLYYLACTGALHAYIVPIKDDKPAKCMTKDVHVCSDALVSSAQ